MDFDQTHWAPVRRRGPLPTYYYHGHFVEMLEFVEAHYRHVLLESHVCFLDDFRRLSRDAQCLYVRLVNRKGRVFAQDKLDYPELGDPGPLVAELLDEVWLSRPGPDHFEDLLQFMTRRDIYSVVLDRFTGMSRSLGKADLIAFVRDHCDGRDFVAWLQDDRLLVQRRIDELQYLLFLYFGRIQDGLSQFTMRDLGLVRTQAFTDSYEPRFSERCEAQEHFYFARRLHALRAADTAGLDALAAECADWPEPEFAGSAAIRDKLACELGRKLEKAGRPDAALSVFGHGESAACVERRIRLLLADGQRHAAEHALERCLENPASDEEWLVADDLYRRHFDKKRTAATTDLLQSAATIDLDESGVGTPERAAIGHFESLGCAAYRTENALWRTLFGLLFWDELFAGDAAGIHSPFEFLPSTLVDRSFAEVHASAIDAKLALLADTAGAVRRILKTGTARYGTPNGVFRWSRPVLDALFALLEHAPAAAVSGMLRRFCKDYKAARYGYPDLMLVEDGRVRFVEIKTEGDQLRRNQMLRLRQLRAAGFEADVVRIRWVLDPDQAYTVVDVETTGGRGSRHRVTEIGAVRVRNGRIVERFQTLLDPQRSIPPGISRLTGITPQMVAGAPIFADVADRLEALFDGAIFVAHNVDFDYGFIAQEFARIGRPFRHPKLCTCASMRRLYPGQKSYSLAALCRAWDIPLNQHHRALCDAEAAAALLLLVNEQRQERLASGLT